MAITDANLGYFYGLNEPATREALRNYFSPYLNDVRNNSSKLASMIPSTTEHVAARRIIEPVKFGRNPNAFGFTAEEGKFADPSRNDARHYSYRTRNMNARLLFSGALIRKFGMDETRWFDVVAEGISDMRDDIAVDMNRILHNDGSGRLAEVGTGSAGVNLNLQLPGISGVGGIESPTTCSTAPAYWFRRMTDNSPAGMRIAVVSSNFATIRGITTISSITNDSTIVTAADLVAAGAIQGDWIVKASTTDATATGLPNLAFREEPMGIAGMFSDAGVADGNGASGLEQSGADDKATITPTLFQGLNATGTFPFNQCRVFSNSNVLRDPSSELIITVLALLEEDNNVKVDMLLSGYREWLRFNELELQKKDYQNITKLESGYSTVGIVTPMGMVPWEIDRDCYRNRIYCIGFETGGFRQYVEEPWRPADYQGAPQWIRLQDDDKYQAPWVTDFNFGVGCRQKLGGLITDIAGTTVA